MSHLAHINAYKQTLIEKGITDPETQIELVRTAYVCAFVRLFGQKLTPFNDRPEVMHYLLSYWNETHPVNGTLVMALTKDYYRRMRDSLINVKGPFVLPICSSEAVTKHQDYWEHDTYDQLVTTLTNEAAHKYNEVRG